MVCASKRNTPGFHCCSEKVLTSVYQVRIGHVPLLIRMHYIFILYILFIAIVHGYLEVPDP